MRPFAWAPAVMALAAMAQQQQQIPTLEVDIISPRNVSYKDTEALPIVVAIQNLTALRAINDATIKWYIMPYRGGYSPTGTVVDMGTFEIPPPNQETDAGTTLLVNYTKPAEWDWSKKQPEDRFVLQWHITSDDLFKRCGGHDALDAYASENFFNFVTAHEQLVYEIKEEELRGPEVTTDCPEFGGVVEVRQNATDASCQIIQWMEDRQGKPCEVKIDQAAVTSIASQVSSMAAPTPTTTTSAEATSTSTGGVGPARTIQTALAAAIVLGGLAL